MRRKIINMNMFHSRTLFNQAQTHLNTSLRNYNVSIYHFIYNHLLQNLKIIDTS